MNKKFPLRPALSALQRYRPYLPAIVTLVGAVLVAVGLFFGQSQAPSPALQYFRAGSQLFPGPFLSSAIQLHFPSRLPY
jgi:hypothetical protein